jgi:hypothetical protein
MEFGEGRKGKKKDRVLTLSKYITSVQVGYIRACIES